MPFTSSSAPVSTAKQIEPLFVTPVPGSQPRQPVINPPVAELDDATAADKPETDTATENHPEDATPTVVTENVDTRPETATDTNPDLSSRMKRRHVMQRAIARTPGIQPNVAANAPGPPATPQTNIEPALPSHDPTPRLETPNAPSPPGSASIRQPPAKVIYPTRHLSAYDSDDSEPVDFASISATAPPPKPAIAKPVRQTGGLVVIVNKANSKPLSKSDISNIYRDRITRWPSGERILVLNLPLDSGERRRFSAAILDMSPLEAATEGSNRTITNRVQNEYRTKNAQVVVSYIEHHENAIGYVQATALGENDNVRVVYSIP